MNQKMSPALMCAIIQCLLNVMNIAMYVIMEWICMDVGWEILATQLMFLVLMCATIQCHLNVMKIAMYVIWELICTDVGWETFANLQMYLVLMFAQIQCPQHPYISVPVSHTWLFSSH